MARVIGSVISRKYPDMLDYRSFNYGNIIPDYDPRLISIPHYKEKSFERITAMIEKAGTINAKQCFSYEIGIINHYICDYFCQAHNYSEYDNYVRHLVYEKKLSNEISRVNLQKYCPANINGKHFHGMESLIHLTDFINNRHIQYKNEKRKMLTDVAFCMEVTTTAIAIIINYSQYNEFARVA